MKYTNKELSDYTDAELLAISSRILDMETADTIKRNTPEFKKRWGNRPAPEANPAFIELKTALSTELATRNKNNA